MPNTHSRLDQAALRRLAVQLAAQLPESREDAQAVVRYLGDLVDFLTLESKGTVVTPIQSVRS